MAKRFEAVRGQFARLVRSRTARDSYVVISGNLLTAALGFLSMIIVTRALGPHGFGLFSAATAVMTIVVGLADLGIGVGLVRLASFYLEKDRRKADVVFRAAFGVEVLVSLVILVVGLAFAPTLAGIVSREKELVPLLRLGILGAAAMSMGSYVTAVLQSRQSFLKLSFYSVITNILKLGLVAFLLSLGVLRLFNAMAVYALVPYMGLLLGMTFMPKSFLREATPKGMGAALLELFHFSKWIMLSYLANTVIIRIDILMLNRFRGAEEAGIYAVAYQLSQLLPIIMGSLITVLLPQASRLSFREEFVNFIKKSLTMSLVVVLVLTPLFLFSAPLIELVFGNRFAASSGIFRILFVNFMLNILFNPIGTVVFALNRPMVTTYTNFFQMLVSIAGNLLLVPLYGGYGAAYTFLSLTIIGSVIITSYVVVKVYRMEPKYGLAV